jgi:hypothetical protein
VLSALVWKGSEIGLVRLTLLCVGDLLEFIAVAVALAVADEVVVDVVTLLSVSPSLWTPLSSLLSSTDVC